MAAITDTDVSLDASGNIRWSSNNTTTHTVLEFIQWLQDKQDDGQAAGDDLLDITVDTPFERSTDQILTLNSPFNIDDNFATHLYDGSVSQTENGGETLYSGLRVIGPVETGTEYMILQDGKLLPGFWGTGINAEAAPSLVFSRHLVKSKDSGVAIDGQRITVLARELGDQYRRFPATLGTANAVAAIGNGSDLFNTTSDATLAGYFGTITNTEGFQNIDIEGTGTTYEFFSQWADGGQSTNDVYEYTKWISQRASKTPSYTGVHTGEWDVVDNGTTQGIAQEIVAPANLELLVGVQVTLRFQGTRTAHTGNVYAELYDSDDASPAIPTGAVLARSENIPITRIQNDTAGEAVLFQFNMLDPSDGTDQRDTMDMTASQTYFIAIRHDEGNATEYLEVQVDSTSPSGTEFVATYNGATWTGDATTAMGIEVYSSPEMHGIAGDRFEGINVSVPYDAETGDVSQTLSPADPYCLWGTEFTYNNLASGPFFPGERAQIWTTSGKTTFVGGCTILFDDATDQLIVAQDTVSSLADTYYIEGLESGANCTVNDVSITDNDKSGGTGIVLAKDDNGTSGELYIQILSGVSPVDNSLVYSSSSPLSNFTTSTTTIESRTINPEFLGTSTGSNIIGAYGQCFFPDDVGSSDTFFDLGGVQRTPPNNQTFTVSGVVAGEDRVLVGPRSGSALNKAQLATDTTLSGSGETTISISTAVQAGTPTSGTIRVELDSGIYRRCRYQSITGTDYDLVADGTFTSGDVDITDGAGGNSVNIASHNYVTLDKVRLTTGGTLPTGLAINTDYYIIAFDAANIQFAASVADAVAGNEIDLTGAGSGTSTIIMQGDEDTATALADFSGDNSTSVADAWISYIDTLARTTSESYSAVFTTPVDLFVRVRDGGATPIKTFENTSAQFLGTPQTVAAVRTNDF
jgi:hypothetical protein